MLYSLLLPRDVNFREVVQRVFDFKAEQCANAASVQARR